MYCGVLAENVRLDEGLEAEETAETVVAFLGAGAVGGGGGVFEDCGEDGGEGYGPFWGEEVGEELGPRGC